MRNQKITLGVSCKCTLYHLVTRWIVISKTSTLQFILSLHTHVSAHLPHLPYVKLWNLPCKCIIACKFVMGNTYSGSKHTWQTRDTWYERCTSQVHSWFAILHMWCTGTIPIDKYYVVIIFCFWWNI